MSYVAQSLQLHFEEDYEHDGHAMCVRKARGVDVGHVQMILALFVPGEGGGLHNTETFRRQKIKGGSYMCGGTLTVFYGTYNC